MVREFGRFAMQRVIDDEDRNAVIEECANNLATWYPDNVSTNAFCAALRSMKSPTRSLTEDTTKED